VNKEEKKAAIDELHEKFARAKTAADHAVTAGSTGADQRASVQAPAVEG